MRLLWATVAGGLALQAGALAAQSQLTPPVTPQPVTLLHQREWSADGICIGPDQCGFCSARNAPQADISLEVAPPDAVAVTIAGATQSTTAAIEIGAKRFRLYAGTRRFIAGRADGRRIIQAMRRVSTLVLHVGDETAARPYAYSLAEFPKAYAAILKACPAAALK